MRLPVSFDGWWQDLVWPEAARYARPRALFVEDLGRHTVRQHTCLAQRSWKRFGLYVLLPVPFDGWRPNVARNEDCVR